MSVGLFDLHLAIAIKAAWETYAGNQALFTGLFPSVESSVSSAWYNKLYPGGSADLLEIRPAYVPEQTKLPCVIIQYSDEPEDSSPMNYFGGVEAGSHKTVCLMIRQMAQCHIFTSHPETTRAVHIALLTGLLAKRSVLYNAGYQDLEYTGGGDLSVEQNLMPNDLGAFVRIQRWQARGTLEFTESPVAGKPVLVTSTDITTDGNIGGVEQPYSGS